MNNQERKNRIIARGEGSNHAHVIVGNAEITRNENGEIIITVGTEGAILKHLLETPDCHNQISPLFVEEEGCIQADIYGNLKTIKPVK